VKLHALKFQKIFPMTPFELANNILLIYSKEDLLTHFNNFTWGKKSFNESIGARFKLEKMTKEWIESNSEDGYEIILNEIYTWGFNKKTPPQSTLSANFKTPFIDLMRTWSDEKSSSIKKINSLERVLSFDRVGIATVSKWICFIDQSRYAIYDSRVSIALSPITLSSGKRALPIIGRRSTKTNKYPSQDAVVSNNKAMSEAYILYLDALQEMRTKVNLTPNQIEMALFMIGK
jgi:hypothetical protein